MCSKLSVCFGSKEIAGPTGSKPVFHLSWEGFRRVVNLFQELPAKEKFEGRTKKCVRCCRFVVAFDLRAGVERGCYERTWRCQFNKGTRTLYNQFSEMLNYRENYLHYILASILKHVVNDQLNSIRPLCSSNGMFTALICLDFCLDLIQIKEHTKRCSVVCLVFDFFFLFRVMYRHVKSIVLSVKKQMKKSWM
jgi:hypothetical protein